MKNKKIIIIVSALIVLTLGIVFYQTKNNIENYKFTKTYEDLTYTEKLVAKVNGTQIYTKKQIQDKEASYIAETLRKIGKLNDLTNKEIIDKEITGCNEILEELHNKNSSGSIYGDSLKSIMDNSISAVENHKKSLECFKIGDLNTFSEFAKKSDADVRQVINELERRGFKN